ncbi:MAG TPA: hypothetical protein VMT43_02760 [Acidimicrobiales bacterium]|nr:hypothetical protein [Acidimicrobiales bacterium]
MRPAAPPTLVCSTCGSHTTGPILRWGSRRREHILCEVCCGPDHEFPSRCGWCERRFHYSGQGRRRYCTEQCRRHAAALRSGRLAPPAEVCCAVCSTSFVGRRADAVYCSASCRQLAYRRRRSGDEPALVAP